MMTWNRLFGKRRPSSVSNGEATKTPQSGSTSPSSPSSTTSSTSSAKATSWSQRLMQSLFQPFCWEGNVHVTSGFPGFTPGDIRHFDRLAQLLPYESIDEEGLITLKGRSEETPEGMGFVIELRPQTGANTALQAEIIGLTDSLPVGSVLAISTYASPMVEGQLYWLTPDAEDLKARASHVPLPALSPDTVALLDTVNAAERAHLLSLSQGNARSSASLPVRHFRVWVACVIPWDGRKGEAFREMVLERRQAMATILQNTALFKGFWGGDLLVATMAELLAPHLAQRGELIRPAYTPYEALSEQMTLPDTEVTVLKRSICFQDHARHDAFATSHVLTHYPSPWNLFSASELLGSVDRGGSQIPSAFIMTSICRVLDEKDERIKAQTHRVRALQMAQTPLSTLTPYYHDKAKAWRQAEMSFTGWGGLQDTCHILTTFARPGSASLTNEALMALARAQGGEWRPMTGIHPLGLMSHWPAAVGPLLANDLKTAGILHRCSGASATAGSGLVLDWQGMPRRADRERPTPLFTLVSRRGELMPIDPFANRAGGYSMAIVGMPGSGKSLLMNQIAFSVLLRGGAVWVIDVGRSYEKTADLFDGDFLEFSSESVWNLNPLQLLRGENGVENLDDVVAILCELLHPTSPMPDFEQSVLTRLVTQAHREAMKDGRVATLKDVDALLEIEASQDRRLADLRCEMAPYLGPFAKWFDGTGRDLAFTNRFTVLELEGLSAHPALRQAVLMMIMMVVERKMAEDRTTIKTVLIDEAWDLMGHGHSARFIESGFRRARKHKGGFVVATQSLADFWSSPAARAAWSCADTRLFLRQDVDQVASLKAKGEFIEDDAFLSVLRSLTTVAGQYSEMLVKVGDQPPAVGRLTLDRLSQLLSGSNPVEVAAINAWRRAGADILTALQAVARGEMHPTSGELPVNTQETQV